MDVLCVPRGFGLELVRSVDLDSCCISLDIFGVRLRRKIKIKKWYDARDY